MKIMHMSVIGLAMAAMLLGGCCGGGTTTKVENQTYTTTVGEQMMDLQKAYDSGAITEKEYLKAKENILKGIEK